MEVWVLIERMNQSEYTEPNYYTAADDTGEVVGVFDSFLKANEEKERLEINDEENRCCTYYYDIEAHVVQ